jgi:hypothetical protein
MAGILVALVLTLVSACALNVGYLIEHSVASKLPPLSFRRPIASLRLLLRPRWLMGFGIEVSGWLLYVLALALAPLSLVQATAAGGIGILAVMVSRYTGVPLTPTEQVGSVLSVAGLAILGISLAGNADKGTMGSEVAVALWLAGSAGVTVLALSLGPRLIGAGPAFGVAAGTLFASGDVSTKTTVAGGEHAVFIPALIISYALGTLVLQQAFQRANALVAAGLATLFTNALPIAAGMTIFEEPLPSGMLGALRIIAFTLVIAGAVCLARHQRGGATVDVPPIEPARPVGVG